MKLKKINKYKIKYFLKKHDIIINFDSIDFLL